MCTALAPALDLGQMVDAELLGKFIFAGRAVFTVQVDKIGQRFTFKVKAKKGNENAERPIWFVQLLTGPNNTADYSYLGYMDSATATEVSLSRKSCAGPNAASVKALNYVLERIQIAIGQGWAEALPKSVKFYHEGSCARCGRPLTDPESIRSGFGPVCINL